MYFRIYEHPHHARPCREAFRQRDHQVRPHWTLRPVENKEPWTPAEVYEQGRTIIIPQGQGGAKTAKNKLVEQLHRTHGERLVA